MKIIVHGASWVAGAEPKRCPGRRMLDLTRSREGANEDAEPIAITVAGSVPGHRLAITSIYNPNRPVAKLCPSQPFLPR
jgi:hypothetical protein